MILVLLVVVFVAAAPAAAAQTTVGFDDTDYRFLEGETLTVAVTLSAAAAAEAVIPITVMPYTSVGFGAETTDYFWSGLTNGNPTFASGDTSKTFTVTANHDGAETQIDDVELDFGTLPSGITKSRASESYRALIRILDDDWAVTRNLREDTPSDRSAYGTRVCDQEGDDLVWWLGDDPDAGSFDVLTQDRGDSYNYAFLLLKPSTVVNRAVKATCEFTFYYSDGNETSGEDVGCTQSTPAPCRADFRGGLKFNVVDPPAIVADPAVIPPNATNDVPRSCATRRRSKPSTPVTSTAPPQSGHFVGTGVGVAAVDHPAVAHERAVEVGSQDRLAAQYQDNLPPRTHS